jgi:hypothetical protein
MIETDYDEVTTEIGPEEAFLGVSVYVRRRGLPN